MILRQVTFRRCCRLPLPRPLALVEAADDRRDSHHPNRHFPPNHPDHPLSVRNSTARNHFGRPVRLNCYYYDDENRDFLYVGRFSEIGVKKRVWNVEYGLELT